MCGIAGFIGYKSMELPRIQRTLDLMANRGPDHRGCAAIKGPGVQVNLLHSRLSIIDLDERSHQPFTIGDCTLIFNGEIYNYLEIREQLIAEHHLSFHTTSDTEVLMQAYLAWGEACVDHLEGMWSFAVYNGKSNKLFLSRDRFGEKPLYYLKTLDGIYFGSEVKFIQSLSGTPLDVNHRHLLRYLINGYKSLYKTSDTFFKGVCELSYGENMTVGSDLQPVFKRYWNPQFAPQPMDCRQAIEGFGHYLKKSIQLRLRSDVPLAFCLSGGIDSSAIVSLAAKVFNYDVAAFSLIDQDQRYNELSNIKATIDDLGCKHMIIDIPREEPFERLKKLIRYHDAPLYTLSYYIHSFLVESISRQGYRVVCSGIAADELVTGYYDHFNLYLYEMRQSPRFLEYLEDWKENAGRLVRNPYLKNPQLYMRDPKERRHIYLNNDIFRDCLKTDFIEPFREVAFSDSLLRSRMMNELFHESTRATLHEDDLNGMFYSIENRNPYLDTDLFQFAYSLPSEFLIQQGYGKYILREAVKGVLNEQVRLDRHKKGFNASIHSIVDLNDRKTREYLLNDAPIYDLVRRDRIEAILDKEAPLPNSYSKFMFNFINAKIFLEMDWHSV